MLMENLNCHGQRQSTSSLSYFPRGVLGEILNLIESVSEDFPSYSFILNV